MKSEGIYSFRCSGDLDLPPSTGLRYESTTDIGGNRPIVFIRFNPDGYKDSQGTKHPSCFKFHKTLCVPIIVDKAAWSNRLELLKARIMHHLSYVPNSEVTIENLFYDGFV